MYGEDSEVIFNEEVEASLLGSIFVDSNNNSIVKKLVNGKITTKHFYDSRHKLIFDAIMKLSFKNIAVDYTTVVKELGDDLRKAGDVDYLTSLTKSEPSTANFDDYYKLVFEDGVKRYWVEKFKIGIEHAKNYSAEEIKAYVEEKIMDIELVSNEKTNWLSEEIDEYEEYLDKVNEGMYDTLYPELEKKLRIKNGDLVIIAGGTGSGKTTLALNWMKNWLEQGYYITNIALEMGKNQTKNRLYSNIASVKNMNIQRKELDNVEKDRVIQANKYAKKYNLNIYEKSMTIEHICNYAKKLHQKGKLDVLVVDHLLLVDTQKPMKRNQQVSYISWKLKALAKDLNIAVVGMMQINREGAKADRPPRKEDLKESGDVENNSDAIVLLHNKSDTSSNDYRGNSVNFIDVIIDKNRDGEIGKIPYHFNKDYQRFIECSWSNGQPVPHGLKDIPQKEIEILECDLPF